MASEVGNRFILGRYLWIMLPFISHGFQSVLSVCAVQSEQIVRNCRSASVLMRSWQFLAF